MHLGETPSRKVLALAAVLVSALGVDFGGSGRAAAGEAPVRTPLRSDLRAPDIIRPEEVRTGMKGYALTVFKGTEPARFDIEVMGKLEMALPQQDIILIRCTGDNVNDTKVAAGMSGSPVYIEEPGRKPRLMGALAYSWDFQLEAIAGVTPITNMLGEEEGLEPAGPTAAPAGRASGARGLAPGRPGVGLTDPMACIEAAGDPLGYGRLGGADIGGPDRAARLADGRVPAGTGAGQDASSPFLSGGLTPVTVPLMVSGLPTGCLAELRRQLAPLGLEPVQGGGGGGGEAGEEAGEGLSPGDAIGVQLMRGDSDWTAIGTVTHVDGKTVLAFGHPFLQAGPWEAPVTRADVQMILASAWTSFKLANSGPVVGKLVDDRQACIAAVLGGKAAMVPVEVEVAGEGRKARTFRYEIVQHPLISGTLAFWALVDSISSGYPWRDDSTITVHQRIELEGQAPIEVETVSPGGGWWGFYQIIRPVSAALYNPFERVKLARLSYRVKIEPRDRRARILSVRADEREVKPGEEVTFYIKMRPFGEEDTELPFKVRVPYEPRRGSFSISFQNGADVTPDIPTPRNLVEYLEAIRAYHTYSADQSIATRWKRTRGLMAEGKVLPALPASVVNVLAPVGSDDGEFVTDVEHIVTRTRWVLSGSAGISLVVRE